MIVFLVIMGFVVNVLVLLVIIFGYGVIYCYVEFYINVDECGVLEFYIGGVKLVIFNGIDV